jgi:hypothetical protein
LNEKLEVMGYDVCKSDAGVYVRCSVDGGKSYVVVGYSLRVDKFIGNVEKCGDSWN